MPRDLLSMLVENVSGLDESNYGLEIIWEINKAVVTFNRPVGKRGNGRSHGRGTQLVQMWTWHGLHNVKHFYYRNDTFMNFERLSAGFVLFYYSLADDFECFLFLYGSFIICWYFADVERFQSSQRLQSQGLTARLLEAAQSVRVEHLPQAMVKGTDQLKPLLLCVWTSFSATWKP